MDDKTARSAPRTGPSAPGRTLPVMYAGLALTAIAALVPLVDVATVDSLAGHVREAYPGWSADLVAADRNAIVTYLSAIGVLGIAGWLWTIRAVAKGKKRARAATTGMFVLGTGIALYNLTASGGEYERIIPALYRVIGLLPSLAGLVAVILVWRLGSPSDIGTAANGQGSNIYAQAISEKEVSST